MDDVLRFDGALPRDPAVHDWFEHIAEPFRGIAREWFSVMRKQGPDVLELFHDGCPVVCLADVPFCYVNVFKAHVNVGFYRGSTLPDPAGMLEGQGKRMRHVKLRPDRVIDSKALQELIEAAYDDARSLVSPATPPQAAPTSRQKQAVTATVSNDLSAARRIDARIHELSDWRGKTLARIRAIILKADPSIIEEWKWSGPVWSHGGIICTGEIYQRVVKTTFARGAALPDPSGLFNSSLTGKTRRAIDFHEGADIDEKALQRLIRAAVKLNLSR